jgi:3-dehydroquinate synthase
MQIHVCIMAPAGLHSNRAANSSEKSHAVCYISSSTMQAIRVKSSAGSYGVECGRGALARLNRAIGGLGDSTGTFVLSSPRVWHACGHAIAARVRRKDVRAVVLFDDAEPAKRMATVEGIARQLVRAGADRRAVVVAVGGGVVGDVAGFAAATYLRGVRLVHVPTTVVAQVDSAIGGKTGVDLPEGKNLVGAFYPPRAVIADPDLLATLPHREYRSGLYEVIKYGVIADRKLFEFLERDMQRILRRDPAALDWIIPRCIAIKARVVSADERESGLRHILNFGHTMGHALEAATGYRRYLHGEAIGWGMIYATCLSLAAGRISEGDSARIIRLIASVGPLPGLGNIRMAQLREFMAGDKKARAGKVLWVVARGIGKTEWGREIGWPMAARTFANLPAIAVAGGLASASRPSRMSRLGGRR